MNDKETAGFAAAIATATDRFKNDLDKASTLAKPDGAPPRRTPTS